MNRKYVELLRRALIRHAAGRGTERTQRRIGAYTPDQVKALGLDKYDVRRELRPFPRPVSGGQGKPVPPPKGRGSVFGERFDFDKPESVRAQQKAIRESAREKARGIRRDVRHIDDWRVLPPGVERPGRSRPPKGNAEVDVDPMRRALREAAERVQRRRRRRPRLVRGRPGEIIEG